jgi:hypothetical protein
VRLAAREILRRAIEAEVEAMPEEFAWVSLTDGRRALVRNGYLPARAILTKEGWVEAQLPKVRDRSGAGAKLNSALAPPYLCRSARAAAAPPWPYPKRISSGDLGEALAVLVGEDAKGLSRRPGAPEGRGERGAGSARAGRGGISRASISPTGGPTAT